MNMYRCENDHGSFDPDELVDGLTCPKCGSFVHEQDPFEVDGPKDCEKSQRKGLEHFLDYVSVEGVAPVLVPSSAYTKTELPNDFFEHE